MDVPNIAKQMISFQKATFDNTFTAMAMLQDQTESMARTLLEQATWLPEEGKKAIDEWINSFKKGRDNYKKMVDDGFKNIQTTLFSYPTSD